MTDNVEPVEGSQCASWGIDVLRRDTEVAMPKAKIEVSISGDEGISRVSGGRVLYSTFSSEVFVSVCEGGKRVSFTVDRSERAPMKWEVLIDRAA